jgi:gamma-glutamyltranspeptidase/glutathione hydrolase
MRAAPLLLLPLLVLPPVAAVPAGAADFAALLQERPGRFRPVRSTGGMVAGQEPRAAAVGAAMLAAGGNAVDAAVAAAFAEAVTLPAAGNLGGGGFLLLWLPGPSPARGRGCLPAATRADGGPELAIGGGQAVAIDYRESAPAAATADQFLRPDGTVDRQRATRSPLSAGVPGSVAGLVLAQRCYGRLPLARVIAPAIALAEQGVTVNPVLAESIADAAPLLAADPDSRRTFLRAVPGGPPRPLAAGEILRQPELAASLRRIARSGHQGFYGGPTAAALAGLMRERGGRISAADLAAYRARLVRPLQISFRSHPVLAPPLPAGGLSLLQLLKLVEPIGPLPGGAGSAADLHSLAEAMALVFRDRNDQLGDLPQPEPVVRRLLDPVRLAELRRTIDPLRHRPSSELSAGPGRRSGGTNTTHLSVVDRHGGLVASTTSLNLAYGSGISVPGAGFLLNNTMDDFSAAPGTANAFGLIQGAANAIAPGRRPLSSMSPTLVFRPDGTPWLATGSPGGSRILTILAQVLRNRLVHGMNLAGAVAAPRIHSQLWPDRLELEEGISPDTAELLQKRGHRIAPASAMGAAHSVEWLGAGRGSLGMADPRRASGLAQPEPAGLRPRSAVPSPP